MAEPQELIELNQRLLNSIAGGDWQTYSELCHANLTCFEPEARGHLVEGMRFHQFYFELGDSPPAVPPNTTMASPKVWMLGPDAAVIAYVRLVQRLGPDGPTTSRYEETRVWQRVGNQWKHIHFHRSSRE